MTSRRVTTFREKPTEEFSVSTGIYLMDPGVFEYIPRRARSTSTT